MNSRCRCERVVLSNAGAKPVEQVGVYSTDCPVHFVREYRTWLGPKSSSLPVGKYARQITEYEWHTWCGYSWMTQSHRRETPAEVQRRLYAEALA